MTDNLERLKVLLLKYSSNVSSSVEEKEMYALLDNSSEEDLQPILTNMLESTKPSYDNQRRERILASILKQTEADSPSTTLRIGRIHLWKRIAVAAGIVGVLFVAGYFFVSRDSSVVSPEEIIVKVNDIQAPDKNRAQIKLADGTVVYLDSAANGELVNVNGVMVMKTADGRIEYSESGVVSGELKFNTLSNPRGSKVMDMTLSDGSRVWLNAGSSITYPVAFVGNERNVNIDGEAYFEIAHNASKPFIVSKNDVNVTVLGTHFNVNAYDDESDIKVTLLEGSVNVSRESSVVRLKPGQQAQIRNDMKLVNGVDVEQIMAWKNGKFSFNRADIKTVMRQLARWYDLEVEYKGTPTSDLFGGDIQRDLPLSKVLDFLKKSQVKFEIEGKKVIVQ